MLVLSRKKEEAIVIGEEITITVLEIKGDRVKLGFKAPKEISIHREEVKRHIELEQNGKGNIVFDLVPC